MAGNTERPAKRAPDGNASVKVVESSSDDADQTQPLPPASLRTYALARAERRRASTDPPAAAASRSATALARAREASRRDEASYRRDVAARARDQAAETRDRAGERQAVGLESRDTSPEQVIRVLTDRMATMRARAAEDRADAAADRARAAVDRAQAALDRRHARVDIARAHLDDLTGVFRRGMGLETIEMEIERAHRLREPFVLAFVDVDGMKGVNDRHGHAEGDALLRAVAAAIESQLRPDDPVVRLGGDEFVCVFPNTDLAAATRRVEEVHAALAQSRPADSISVGLAVLGPEDTLEDMIAQGDAAVYRIKRNR